MHRGDGTFQYACDLYFLWLRSSAIFRQMSPIAVPLTVADMVQHNPAIPAIVLHSLCRQTVTASLSAFSEVQEPANTPRQPVRGPWSQARWSPIAMEL